MSRLSPRDVHIGTVAGGGLIGLALAVLGTLDFNAAFGGPNQWIWVIEGATWIVVGALFVLVSVIVLPAWRAGRLEREGPH